MHHNGKRVRAHRVYYERKYGPIPHGLEPDHLCGIKACVNPDHIEPVTHTENVRRGTHTKLDLKTVRKIREAAASGHYTLTQLARRFELSPQQASLIAHHQQWPDPHSTHLRPKLLQGNQGTNHKHTSLTDEKVLEIRRRYREGSVSLITLARAYGVSQTTVHNIVRRKAWTHI